MLTALNDLDAKGILEELVGLVTVINEIYYDVIGDNVGGLLDSEVVIIRDRGWSSLV